MQSTENVSRASVKDLLRLYGEIIQTLRQRAVCTTNDGPIGGYGEWLVARAFGGERQTNSKKGFDILTVDRVRLQVKTRWLPLGGELRQLSAIRKLNEDGFDFIVAVLLDGQFDVVEAYQLPHAAVSRLATFAPHTNSHKLILTPKVCRDAECIDVRERLRAAAQERPSSTSNTST